MNCFQKLSLNSFMSGQYLRDLSRKKQNSREIVLIYDFFLFRYDFPLLKSK